MRAVIYARYSSDRQREESIEGQLRECEAWAQKNDVTIIGTYIDRALSAKTDDRPNFQQMVKDSSKRQFDVVLVWKLDRFARNRYDSAHYKRILSKNGVKVVSATEPIAEGSSGILLETMLEGMAEYYSIELGEKIDRGLTENVLHGKANGGKPTFGLLVNENREFVHDPLKAPIVLDVFKRYDTGATMKQISADLAERGIKNGKDGPLSVSTIERMLKNRRYIGEYRLKETVNPDAIPPIIPRELFDRVQQKLAKNVQAPARYKAKEDMYLLSTKIFCGDCGAYMIGESGTSRTKGMTYRYYKCGNAKRGKGCKRKAIKKSWIEDIVIEHIMGLLNNNAIIEDMADAIIKTLDEENTVLPVLARQLAEIEKGIENILNAIEQGIITTSTKERLETLEARREMIKTDIAREEIIRTRLTKDQIIFWLSRFRTPDMPTSEQRQRLVDVFLNAVYVYDDKLLIVVNGEDGTTTVTFPEVNQSLPATNEGSDTDSVSPPSRGRSNLGLCY